MIYLKACYSTRLYFFLMTYTLSRFISFCFLMSIPFISLSQNWADSMRYYTHQYNLRVEEVIKDKLGDTYDAIGKMTAQDTAAFTPDSINRLIERGNRAIAADSVLLFYDRKMKECMVNLKRQPARKDE